MEHTVSIYKDRHKELSDARVYYLKNGEMDLYKEVYEKY